MIRSAATILLVLTSCAAQPDGGSWPQWRGPRRDNVCDEKGLLKEWPAGGPPLALMVDGIGEGIAGIVVANGRIFAMGFMGDSEFLTALDEKTGERLWAVPIGTKKGKVDSTLMRWLMQRAPTVDEDRVYAFSGDGTLVCAKVRDGRILWRKNHSADLGGKTSAWGLCDYPLVDGERVLTVVDGGEPAMVALNKRTGDLIWRASTPPLEEKTGWEGEWAATVVSHAGGVRQYVAVLKNGAFGFRSEDGKILWRHEQGVPGGYHYPRTPLVSGNSLFLLSGHSGGLDRLNLSPDGTGVAVAAQYVERKTSQLFTQDSAVLVGDHLYAQCRPNWLTCIDADSGKVVWNTRLSFRGNSSFVYAEGCLVMHNSDATVALVAITPEKMTERSTFKMPERPNGSGAAAPVIAGGRLYLRDEARLYGYELREGRPGPEAPVRRVFPPPARPVVADPQNPGQAVFVPTPQDVVAQMVQLAKVGKDDVLYDLGSGDGRIVLAAGSRGGRAVGFEIEEKLVRISRAAIERAGLAGKVAVEQKDLFTVDLSPATVIAVYLPESLLERLKPQFERLKDGTRIVSHQFRIPGMVPDQMVAVDSSDDGTTHAIYLWTTPLRKSKE